MYARSALYDRSTLGSAIATLGFAMLVTGTTVLAPRGRHAAAGEPAAPARPDTAPAVRAAVPEPPSADSGTPPSSVSRPRRPNTLAALVRGGVRGVRMIDVDPSGAAARAGIRPGDLLRSLNGQHVASATDLDDLVARLEPGSKVPAVVLSRGRELNLTIDFGVRAAEPNWFPSAPRPRAWLGVDLVDNGRGVLVTGVVPGGPAAQAGIREGDILVRLDGQRVIRVAEGIQLLGQMTPGNSVDVVIQRDAEESPLTAVLGSDAPPPYVNRYYGGPWYRPYLYRGGGAVDVGPIHVEW